MKVSIHIRRVYKEAWRKCGWTTFFYTFFQTAPYYTQKHTTSQLNYILISLLLADVGMNRFHYEIYAKKQQEIECAQIFSTKCFFVISPRAYAHLIQLVRETHNCQSRCLKCRVFERLFAIRNTRILCAALS